MRVVFVSERTRLEQEIANEGVEDSVRRNYSPEIFASLLRAPHDLYRSEKSHIERTIRSLGISLIACLRQEVQSFVFRPDDVVVILGDDGAFVNIAKLLTQQRVITVATSAKTCGRLMMFTTTTFAEHVKRLLGESPETVAVSIARATTSLGHTLEAVNDFFVGRADLRSSRYAIVSREGTHESQVSSGVIVSTGTGSTGWERSARRGDRHYRERPLDDTTLSVVTRELCHGRDLGNIDGVGEITFQSHDNETRVVADGVLLDAAMLLLPAGATVSITAHVRAVQLCV